MHPIEHHTLYRRQESELARRAEQVRQARERRTAEPERATGRREPRADRHRLTLLWRRTA